MTWNSGYKARFTLWRRIINPPSTSVTWPSKTLPSKLFCQLPISIYPPTLLPFTLSFHRTSSVLDLLASDKAAICDLLILDRINQTIVNLERQLEKNHRLAAQRFPVLLQHRMAQQLPQHIHDILQPDCRHCRLCRQQPIPFQQPSQLVVSSSSSSSSSSTRNRYWQVPPYPTRPNPIPVASTSTVKPPLFPPLTTCSGWVYPWNYFTANAADCLRHLQTIPEERQWGTAAFPIVVEDPEAEDDIFQCYYHWFINEGHD